MVSVLGSIFGSPDPKPQAPSPAPPPGPSPEAEAAQAKETKLLDEKEAKKKREARSSRAVIAARSGRGQGITLNPITGERGVIGGGKLGGGS